MLEIHGDAITHDGLDLPQSPLGSFRMKHKSARNKAEVISHRM